MKYKDLLDALKELSAEELEMTATVVINNQDYVTLVCTDRVSETDVLDKGHPILVVDLD